jgi:hypothetical protein
MGDAWLHYTVKNTIEQPKHKSSEILVNARFNDGVQVWSNDVAKVHHQVSGLCEKRSKMCNILDPCNSQPD